MSKETREILVMLVQLVKQATLEPPDLREILVRLVTQEPRVYKVQLELKEIREIREIKVRRERVEQLEAEV